MEEDYKWFQTKIKQETGIDLFLYKEEQMKRRLTNLVQKKGAHSFQQFYKMMSEDPAILQEFLDKVTINVTEFFRNRKRWEVLEDKILPRLLKNNHRPIRIWSAACSTGEEPYSLSILFSKSLPTNDYSILATDLDEQVLKLAKKGVFSEKTQKGLEQSEILRYFKREKNFYEIKSSIKQPIVFKKHNLLSDPYGTGFDLIVCRNVMIYFTEEAKQSIYKRFAEALRPGGVLFVGSTEQIFNPQQFQLQSIETFFYEKLD